MKKIFLPLLVLALFAGPRLATAGAYATVPSTSASLQLFRTNASTTAVTYTPSTVVQPGISMCKLIASTQSGQACAFTLWDLPVANPVTYAAKARSLGQFSIPTTRLGEIADYTLMQGVGNSVGIPIQGYLGIIDASGATTATVKVIYTRNGTNPAAAPSF